MSRFAISVAIIALVALGTMPVVWATASPPERASSPHLAQETVTIVTLDSLMFDPDEVSVSPGQVVVVVNDGALLHDLVVDEWGIATGPLNGGDTASFTVPGDAEPGTSVAFYCTTPGHSVAGQTGTFTVTTADGTMPDTPNDEGMLEIEATDRFMYSPAHLEVYPGQEVRVTNDGTFRHGLVVDAWDIDVSLPTEDDQATFTVPDDAEEGSTVTFYCPFPGHQQSGMNGTFTVIAPPPDSEQSAIDDLNATIAALEQEQADLSATTTAIATHQAEIDEQIVTLEIQRDALIEATADAQQAPTPTVTMQNRPARSAPGIPTPTPEA